MKRWNEILEKFGVSLNYETRILDFGCGEGKKVYSLLDQGYKNVFGFDIWDRLALRDPADRSLSLPLPMSRDASFLSTTTALT